MVFASKSAFPPIHPWVRPVRASWVDAPYATPLIRRFREALRTALLREGHHLLARPEDGVELLLTPAPLFEPLRWRDALLFTARRRFGLSKTPTIVSVIHAPTAAWEKALDGARAFLADPERFRGENFPYAGMAESAWEALLNQGRRGGPVLLLERVLQAQSKSIRVLLLVGDDALEEAYLFDLVGAYPRLRPPAEASPEEREFLVAANVVRRLATVVSTREITAHETVAEPLPWEVWQRLEAPKAMKRAGREFGRRDFFTETISIDSLVHVPAVSDAIADQYSEGCYATWEPEIDALVATITGSARPFDKTQLTDDELALIVGVRPDKQGAVVRHVLGKRNDPPSSEAVELFDMDEPLPRVAWEEGGRTYTVPVARSKLHGHRGIRAYDPRVVEYVPMDEAYFHYPVSCSTEAQAMGIRQAFARSQALRNPDDPRKIAFTIIPGHGVLIAEKWVRGKAPFQVIWEAMDAGALEITPRVPQGPFRYAPGADGRMHWDETEEIPLGPWPIDGAQGR
ncbi:MAG: hypothetical protein BLITH_1240 [Brockia lithotrophica]|uniref:Uncharacterized protein n=1 Tax=Brockia lithotrophica TaxID=933949 RepID=A0A2T5G5Y3_9BACL|nr:MAG: hypothetical protein BLITH_1240 [Brockia lithotrophica]